MYHYMYGVNFNVDPNNGDVFADAQLFGDSETTYYVSIAVYTALHISPLLRIIVKSSP